MLGKHKLIFHMPDMAAAFGSSEASIRGLIARKNWDAIPSPFKLGTRWAWRAEDVEAWLVAKAANQVAEQSAPSRPVGRPRKTRKMEP